MSYSLAQRNHYRKKITGFKRKRNATGHYSQYPYPKRIKLIGKTAALREKLRKKKKMPRRYRKKSRGKKRRLRIITRTVRSPNHVMPDVLRCRMVCWEQASNFTGLTQKELTINANNIFQPLAFSTGTQPMGYDQLSVLFQRYKVFGTKVTVRMAHDLTEPVRCCMYASHSSSPITSFERAVTQPFSINWLMSQDIDKDIRSYYMRTAKIFGQKIAFYNGFAGAVGGAPTHKWYIHIVFGTADATTDLGANNVYIQVRVTQYVRWDERISLPASTG